MHCTSCGGEVGAGERFCAVCGAPVAGEPPPTPMAVARVRPTVVTILAILKAVVAVCWLGIALLFAIAAAAESGAGAAVLSFFAAGFGMLGGLAAAGAYGLWNLRPYGRILQIVLSCVGILIGFPFGSIISILIIVYLFQPGVKLLFSARSLETMTPDEARLLHGAGVLGRTAAVVIALVVAVLVVPMTAIIAAIAIPNLLNAIDRGKQKRTMADIRSIAIAVEEHAVQHGAYPVADSILALETAVVPAYIKAVPRVDGWTHPLQFESTATGYSIYSFGKDGTGDSCEPAVTTRFADDICFVTGQFVRYPQGTQQ